MKKSRHLHPMGFNILVGASATTMAITAMMFQDIKKFNIISMDFTIKSVRSLLLVLLLLKLYF